MKQYYSLLASLILTAITCNTFANRGVASVGDPSVFGDNVWNVYVWNAGGASDIGQSWNANYAGYYVESSLSFDTRDRWDPNFSPSYASGYQGDAVGSDNHSWSAKRQGFPCGHYKISIPGHDDEAQLFVDGVKVWEHIGCCDSHPDVWEGDLGTTSKIEFRTTEGDGSSYGIISFNATYAAPVPSISPDATCGNSITLTSSIASGNQWYLNGIAINGATSQTYVATVSGSYTVKVTSDTCTTTSAPVSISIIAGDPAIFGNNVWNVYAWNAGAAVDNGQSWNVNYTGYYTDTALNLDTRNKWDPLLSPSAAPGYQGCTVGIDNHSWSAKRQGFSCGHYQISIVGHDDEAQLFVNGVKVWEHTVCCDSHPDVWEGDLGPNSKIEFRATEGSGGSFGAIAIDYVGPITTPVISAGSCHVNVVALTSSITLGNQWYLNDTAITGATSQTYTATVSGSYGLQVLLEGCTTTSSPFPVTILTAGDPSVFGTNVWNVYAWNAGTALDSGQSWNTNYSGYYIDSAVSLDTRSKWDQNLSPSSAPGYQGCTIQVDHHSWSAKRKGFPCGHYRISITGHDDEAQLFIDGSKVWEHLGCCDAHPNVWEGQLGPDSRIEFRGTEGEGGSFGAISIDYISANPAITSSPNCSINNVPLTSSSDSGNQWYFNGTAINGATSQTYMATVSGNYSVQVTSGGCVATSPSVSIVPGLTDPSVFGNNVWNVYAWNAGDAVDTTQSWKTNYSGYYIDSTLNLDTRNRWGSLTSPSSAPGYIGCPVNVDHHSWNAKRQGFRCGHYKISIPGHDDYAELLIDGIKVWDHFGFGDSHSNVWEGDLLSTSKVEFRGTDGTGDSYGAISFNLVTAIPAVPSISSNTTSDCNGNPITLTSSSAPGNQWFLNGAVINGATAQTYSAAVSGTYTVQVTSGTCTSLSAPVIIIIGSVGDPSVFGDNKWNVYAWNAGDASDNGQSWNTNYKGYYVDTAFNFDTRNKWNNLASPSSAAGYLGCSVNADNHSWSAKRKGFPCGYYRISIPGHDDEAQLFVNGVKVWEHIGCCDSHDSVWQGNLGPQSTIEFRATEGGGASYGAISFMKIPFAIGGIKFICPGSQTTLDAGAHDSYLWSTSETTQTITIANAGTYSASVTDGSCSQTASVLVQDGTGPLDSLTVSATSSSSCPGSKVVLDAKAVVNNTKIYGTRTYYMDVSNLINMSSSCGSAIDGNNNTWGFTWKDSGNSPVASVKIEFARGIQEYSDATYGTKLNGANGLTFFSPYWQGCDSYSGDPVITMYPNPQSYVVGGNNTFLITNGNYYYFGLRHWSSLEGYFAKVTVTYQSDLLFTWSPGNFTTQSVTVYPTETTDYTVTANYKGCVSNASYHVMVNPVPTISINGGSNLICPNSSVTLTASNGNTYLWSNGETTKSITVSAAGTYSVTVDNCSSSQVTIGYKPMPTISASSYTTFCPGQSITLTASAGLAYLWSTAETTQSIQVSAAGGYTVQVTDSTGCAQSSGVTNITVQPLDTPTTSTTSYCSGIVSMEVVNYPIFGQGYVFNWYKAGVDTAITTNFQLSTTEDGDYYVIASRSGCSSAPSQLIHVVVPKKGDPSVFGNNQWNVYYYQDLNGGYYYYGYGTPNYEYEGYYTEPLVSFDTRNRWDPGYGPYVDSNYVGCPGNSDFFLFSAKRKGFPCGHYSIDIPGHDDDAALYINGVQVWQAGCCNVGTNVWQGDLGPESEVEFAVTEYTGDAYGAITFNLLDSNIVIKPTITPAGPITICALDALVLTSSVTTNNLWSTGDTIQSIPVTTSGFYTVTQKGPEGCTAQSDSVNVTVTTAQTYYADADGDGYGNAAVSVQSCTAPAGYVTTSGDCDDADASVHPGAPEICDGKDNNCDGVIDEGCGAITVTANKTSASACADDGAIRLLKTGGIFPFTYSIDGTHYQSSNKFTGLSAGTYTGFVKDSKNHLGTVSGITITKAAAVVVSALKTTASFCADDGTITVTKTGGIAPFTYSIDGVNFATSNKFTALAAGTYMAYVKDAKCPVASVDGIVITKAAELVAAARATAADFCADDGTITITRTGGTPPFTYSIDGVSYQTSNKFTGVAGGTYTAYVKDARCPAVSLPGVVVDKTAPIVISVKKTAASFCADDGTIVIIETGGTAPFTYSLDGVNFVTSNKFTGLGGGTYTAWVKDARCPAVSLPGTVIAKAAPLVVKATKTDATACYDDGTITLTRTGGLAPFTYSLDGVNFVTTNVFTGLAAGTYTGWVKDSRCPAVSLPGITISTAVCNSISSSSSTGGENSNLKVVNASMQIFPNPANDVLNIELHGYNGKVTLQLRDIEGKALLEKKLDVQSANVLEEQMNVRKFSSGVYLVMAIDGNGNIQTEKVVIAH